MSQISRLKDAEISNGNLINADDLDAEFNQIVAAHNANDTILSDIATGTYTFSGVKTFSSTPKMNAIAERTSGSGVTADGVLLKDGAITLAQTAGYTPAADGDFGYDSTADVYKGRQNGSAVTFLTTGTSLFPKGYLGGPQPTYASAASITIPAGCRARSSDNTADIEAAGNLTVSLASSGANGLDTGTEANDTWYFVYLIKNPTSGTVAGLLSVTNEAASGSVTLPTDYTLKRQLPLAVRNNGSGDLVPFVIGGGWPYRPHVLWRDYEESATYRVLNAGTQTTFTAVSMAGLVPPIAKLADLYVDAPNAGDGGIFLRATGSSLTNGRKVAYQTTLDKNYNQATDVQTDASQSIDYMVAASGSTSLWVWGWTATEVN